MSGRKIVTMDRNEADDLRRKARVGEKEKRRRKAAEDARDAANRRAHDLEADLAARSASQRRIERELSRVDQRLAESVAEQHRAREASRAETRAAIAALAGEQRRELTAVEGRVNRRVDTVRKEGAEREKRLRTLVDEREAAVRAEVGRVRADVQQLVSQLDAQTRTEQQRLAWWTQLLETELDIIEREYRHELFAPGELSHLRGRAAMAAQTGNEGLAQAAIAATQETWVQASALRARLEQEQAEWETQRALAREEVAVAQAALTSKAEVELRLPGQAPFTVVVDTWSEGGVAALQEQVDQARSRVEDEERPADTRELVDVRAKIATVSDDLVTTVAEARDAVLASIERHDLLERYGRRLRECGWVCIDGAWDDDDQRRSLRAVYRNPVGEKLAVGLVPGGPGASPVMELDFQDHSRSELERRERLRVLFPDIPQEAIDTPAGASDAEGRPEVLDLRGARATARAQATSKQGA